ncbi:DUF397 domain-containing protein [Streptomyces himalayensis]|nr:DUF397 domain-containing protein [Streptomyces himalayensis]
MGVAGYGADASPDGAVAILDSKRQDGPVLEVTQGAWSAFLAYARV